MVRALAEEIVAGGNKIYTAAMERCTHKSMVQNAHYRRHTTNKIKKAGSKYKSAVTAIQGVRMETTDTH